MDVYKIGEIPKSAYKLIGPKARGLNEIKKIGIKTPLGVVITNIDYEKNGDGMFHDLYLKNNFKQITLRTESNNPDVDQIYNNKQFVKIFNIEGPEMFIKAVNTAIAAYFDNMQKTFSDFFPHQQEDCLVIIVQEMIVCTKAGFCMSRNPTTGANEFYIRGIKGIGEKVLLNSSIANVYHIPYTIKNNEIVKYNKPVGDGLLSEKQLAELIIDACNIKKIINDNVDLNWLYTGTEFMWVQTSIMSYTYTHDINELDSDKVTAEEVIAKNQITWLFGHGSTPLTLLVVLEQLNASLAKIKNKFNISSDNKQIFINFNNTVFCNMTSLYNFTDKTFHFSPSITDLSFCGKILPLNMNKNLITDVSSTALSKIKKFINKSLSVFLMENMIDDFVIIKSEDPYRYLDNIINSFDKLKESGYYLLLNILFIGNSNNILINFLVNKCGIDIDVVSEFMNNITANQNLEVKNMKAALWEIACIFKKENAHFLKANDQALIDFIVNGNGLITEKWEKFIFDYGHRGFDECELRSKTYKTNVSLFVKKIKEYGARTKPAKIRKDPNIIISEFMRKIHNPTLAKKAEPLIRDYINNLNKHYRLLSFYIKVVDIFRTNFENLATLMTKLGILPDADLIYFFKLNELKILISQKRYLIILIGKHRRDLYKQQSSLRYEAWNLGKPKLK